jgi:hypothetical protein
VLSEESLVSEASAESVSSDVLSDETVSSEASAVSLVVDVLPDETVSEVLSVVLPLEEASSSSELDRLLDEVVSVVSVVSLTCSAAKATASAGMDEEIMRAERTQASVTLSGFWNFLRNLFISYLALRSLDEPRRHEKPRPELHSTIPATSDFLLAINITAYCHQCKDMFQTTH